MQREIKLYVMKYIKIIIVVVILRCYYHNYVPYCLKKCFGLKDQYLNEYQRNNKCF